MRRDPYVPRSSRSRVAVGDLSASVLVFLGADDERFDRFLGTTGLSVTDLREVSRSEGFAESLLDYLCSDEPLLRAYAQDSGHDPAEIEAVRTSLAPHPADGW